MARAERARRCGDRRIVVFVVCSFQRGIGLWVCGDAVQSCSRERVSSRAGREWVDQCLGEQQGRRGTRGSTVEAVGRAEEISRRRFRNTLGSWVSDAVGVSSGSWRVDENVNALFLLERLKRVGSTFALWAHTLMPSGDGV